MITHLVSLHGRTPRHERAQQTWEPLYKMGVKPLHLSNYSRTAQDIGDPRSLPYIKDMLSACTKLDPENVILWTNDDIGLDPRIIGWAEKIKGAASMRRDGYIHMGRDLIAFTRGWLDTHWGDIPDYIIGCPCFDLGLAAKIRLTHGIRSTFRSFELDIPPAETPDRFAHHEPHKSAWAGPAEHKLPANLWNKRLANEWFKKAQLPIHL